MISEATRAEARFTTLIAGLVASPTPDLTKLTFTDFDDLKVANAYRTDGLLRFSHDDFVCRVEPTWRHYSLGWWVIVRRGARLLRCPLLSPAAEQMTLALHEFEKSVMLLEWWRSLPEHIKNRPWLVQPPQELEPHALNRLEQFSERSILRHVDACDDRLEHTFRCFEAQSFLLDLPVITLRGLA